MIMVSVNKNFDIRQSFDGSLAWVSDVVLHIPVHHLSLHTLAVRLVT